MISDFKMYEPCFYVSVGGVALMNEWQGPMDDLSKVRSAGGNGAGVKLNDSGRDATPKRDT